MRDVDDIEGECIKTIVRDVLISMSFPSEYYLSDNREEITRQVLPQNICEGILHEFIDCAVGKRLMCFQTHLKCFL